jgi:hypothetical protein
MQSIYQFPGLLLGTSVAKNGAKLESGLSAQKIRPDLLRPEPDVHAALPHTASFAFGGLRIRR